MKLVKTNESWQRSFDANGEEATDRLTDRQYNIVDDEDRVVGSSTIHSSHADVNIYGIGGFSTIEEGEAKLKALFGITD